MTASLSRVDTISDAKKHWKIVLLGQSFCQILNCSISIVLVNAEIGPNSLAGCMTFLTMTKEISKMTSESLSICYLLIITTFISPQSPMRIPSLPGIWTLHSGLAQLIPKEQLCYRLILVALAFLDLKLPVGQWVIEQFNVFRFSDYK